MVVSKIKNGKQRQGHKQSCKYGCTKINENYEHSNQMTPNICCSSQNDCSRIDLSKLDIKEKCDCNERENKENLEHER